MLRCSELPFPVRWFCAGKMDGYESPSITKVRGIPAEHIGVDETSITTKQIGLNREEIENDTSNLINALTCWAKYGCDVAGKIRGCHERPAVVEAAGGIDPVAVAGISHLAHGLNQIRRSPSAFWVLHAGAVDNGSSAIHQSTSSREQWRQESD